MNGATVAELLTRGGEWSTPDHDRASDTRRWAYYRIGAFMCGRDTGAFHGPENAHHTRLRELDARLEAARLREL